MSRDRKSSPDTAVAADDSAIWSRPSRFRSAFTLIELLTVIAVLGVLAGLLLPALNKARERSRSALCLSQLKQLALAAQLYAMDYESSYPYNFGAADTRRTIRDGTFLNWVNNVMTWELDADNTNRAWAVRGGLGPYLTNHRIYRCPSDRVLSALQKTAGWTHRIRSYSMNAMVGNAGEFSIDESNVNNPKYRQFLKEDEVPNPSTFFVFIEEHPDSVNDGYFLNKFYSNEWFDLPASWHLGSANMTFADGHAESRRWKDPSTRPANLPDAARLPFPVPENERSDYRWLMQRTSLRIGAMAAH